MFVILFFGCFIIYAKADVFSAIEDIKKLLDTEKYIPDVINSYLNDEQNRLQKINQMFEEITSHPFFKVEDTEAFLGNPINIYHLLNWLNDEVRKLLTMMAEPHIKGAKISEKDHLFPDNKDFSGIIEGLNRLVNVYDLNISNVANGELIPGTKAFNRLSAMDCFEIGFELFKYDKYSNAIPWLEESRKLDKIEEDSSIDREFLFDSLSYSYYMMKNYKKAVEVLEDYLHHNVKTEKIQNNYKYYKKMLNKQVKQKKVTRDNLNGKYKEYFEKEFSETWKHYKKLCQKKYSVDNKDPNLRCYYSTQSSPTLILQPIAIEDIHRQPWIALFYDVVKDNEIEIMKNLSVPKLLRPSIVGKDGVAVFVDDRVSKSAWIRDEEHAVIKKLNQRLETITGLKVSEVSKPFQVINYGLGGHYKPHIDYDEENKISELTDEMGNRLATILIYMTDVLAGGVTIFPRLNLGVSPIKGSALFWFNFLKTGKENKLTEHAECPVLSGNKWVANKWIHTFHQDFKRLCGSRYDDLFYENSSS